MVDFASFVVVLVLIVSCVRFVLCSICPVELVPCLLILDGEKVTGKHNLGEQCA